MKLVSSLLLVTVFCACNKESATKRCISGTPGRLQYGVLFRGFAPADVDTLVTRRYVSDGSFSTLLNADTVFFPDAAEVGGTVYPSAQSGSFLNCNNEADYEIVVPAVAKTYRVWDVAYGPDTAAVEYEATDCKPRTFSPVRPRNAQISGEHEVEPKQYSTDIYFKP